MAWIKQHWKDMLLTLVSVVVTVVVLDIGLYYTHFRGLIHIQYFPQHYFVKDTEMGFDIPPNTATTTQYLYDGPYKVWSNSIGCFDTEYSGETPYVYVTGDSFTWGFTPFEQKWGTLVQQELGTRLVKCGVPGFGTHQQLIKTKRDMARLPAPELIIVGYTVANDLEDDVNFPNSTVYDGYKVPTYHDLNEAQAEEMNHRLETYCINHIPEHPLLQESKCWLYNNSVIYNVMRTKFRATLVSLLPKSLEASLSILSSDAVSTAPAIRPDLIAKHLDNLRQFKSLADQKDAKLLVVVFPAKADVCISQQNRDTYKERATRVATYLDTLNVPHIDLFDEFASRGEMSDDCPLFWKHEGHWDPRGNKLVGLVVGKYLLEHPLIPVQHSDTSLENINKALREEFATTTSVR